MVDPLLFFSEKHEPELLEPTTFTAAIPLVVHSVEFNDELINPISQAENSFEFISTDS